MPDWIAAELKGMGLLGVVIFLLLKVIVILGVVIKILWGKYTALNDERCVERQAFMDVMNAKSSSDLQLARSHEERNDVERELGEAFKAQSASFDRVNDRVELFHDDNKDRLKDINLVVGSLADGVRTIAANVAANTKSVDASAAIANETKNWIQAPPRARAPRRRK